MTIRTKAELDTLYADNVTGAISPQDLRDGFDSVMGVYGGIIIEGGSTAQAFATGVAEIMTEWTGNDIANGVTPDEANNKITIDNDGVYMVTFCCSFAGNNPIVNEFELRKNGAVTGIKCQRKTTSTDIGSCSFARPISLVSTDELSVWFTGDGNSNFTAQEAALTAHRIA